MLAVALALGSLTQAQMGDVLYSVETKDPHAATKATSALKGIGKIGSLDGRAGITIRIPLAKADAAAKKLEAHGLKPSRREFVLPHADGPLGGRMDLHQRVTDAQKRRAESGGKGHGLSYLRALEHFTKVRAYPFQTVDWDAINREAQYRHQMKDYRPPTPEGAFQSSTWQYVGPRNLDIPYRTYFGQPPLGGRTNAIAYDPTDPTYTYYLGAANGGVWKTTNGGLGWTPLSDGWDTQPVNCILVVDANTIYVGLGDLHGQIQYGSGIMKSTDAGATWTKIGLPTLGTNVGVTHIVKGNDTGTTLIAGTGGGPGFWGALYRSTDSGATWSLAHSPANTMITGLSSRWTSTGWVVYAATAGYADQRLHRSDDGGLSWSSINVPGTLSSNDFSWSYDVTASVMDENTLYFLAPAEQKILRSTDRGASWLEIQAGLIDGGGYNWSQGWYDYHINCGTLPDANFFVRDAVYVGLIDLGVWSEAFGGAIPADNWRSVGGPTWDGGASVLHNDQHSFAPASPGKYEGLIGCDGGIFRMDYNSISKTFELVPLNRGLYTHQFYHLDVHPTLDNTLLGGTQDNATPLLQGDLLNWRNVGGGDGAYSAINRTNPNIQFTSAQDLAIVKTTDSWATSTWLTRPWTGEAVGFIAPFELRSSDQNRLLAGTNHVWQYDTSADSWTRITGDVGGGQPILSIASTLGEVYYTGGVNGSIYHMSDGFYTGGITELNIKGDLPTRAITDIEVPGTAIYRPYVTLGGTGTGNVFRAAGDVDLSSSVVWTDISGVGTGRLPQVPTHTIVADPRDPENKLWVGNDLGVFVTEDGGVNWQDATQSLGLPIVIVHKLHFDPRTETLYAGTFGRGIWKISLVAPRIANLAIVPSTVYRGHSTPIAATVMMTSTHYRDRVVQITRQGGPAGITFPASVTVPANQQSASFEIGVGSVAGPGFVTFQATYNSITATAPLTIRTPYPLSLSLNPTTATGGNQSTATLTLDAPAMPGGQTFSVGSYNTARATTPASVTVPGGATSATFTVNAVRSSTPGSVTIAAGGLARPLNVIQATLSSVTFPGTEVSNGVSLTGTVSLQNPAPSGGAVVNLTASPAAAVNIPASVSFAAGERTKTFTLTGNLVGGDTSVTVFARQTVGSVTLQRTANVWVRRRSLVNFTIAPTAVTGGGAAVGTVTISGTALPGGAVVRLINTNPALITIPATVTIPAGQTSATFNINTVAPTTSTVVPIGASYAGISRTTGLRVNP
jgi:hypothetical protein